MSVPKTQEEQDKWLDKIWDSAEHEFKLRQYQGLSTNSQERVMVEVLQLRILTQIGVVLSYD